MGVFTGTVTSNCHALRECLQDEQHEGKEEVKVAAKNFFAALSAEAEQFEHIKGVVDQHQQMLELLQQLGFEPPDHQTEPRLTLVESKQSLCEAAQGVCHAAVELLLHAKVAAAEKANDRRLFERVQRGCCGSKRDPIHWDYYVHTKCAYEMVTSTPGAPRFEPRPRGTQLDELGARLELMKALVEVLMDNDEEHEIFQMETDLITLVEQELLAREEHDVASNSKEDSEDFSVDLY